MYQLGSRTLSSYSQVCEGEASCALVFANLVHPQVLACEIKYGSIFDFACEKHEEVYSGFLVHVYMDLVIRVADVVKTPT